MQGKLNEIVAIMVRYIKLIGDLSHQKKMDKCYIDIYLYTIKILGISN